MQLKASDNISKLYIGPSMNPTLKDLDILEIMPYNNDKVKIGDVITFISKANNKSVTHRVAFIDERGIITLGDNNNQVDLELLQPEDIIGKVIYAKRKNRHIKIYNGNMGRLYAKWIRSIRKIRIGLRHALMAFRPLYRFIYKRSNPLGKYLPPKLQPRVLTFSKGSFVYRQLVLGKRVIGKCSPDGTKWHIKPPFRLFIDEKNLNDMNSKKSS